MPVQNVPRHSSTKLPVSMPNAAVEVPTIPIPLPNMKPARRPQRAIASDAGTVVSAEPTMYAVMGSVANSGVGDSASPARPLIEISVTLLTYSSAWQMASSEICRPAVADEDTVDSWERRL